MTVKSLQSYLTLSDPVDWKPARLLYPWIFPGKDTGLGVRASPRGASVPRDGAHVSYTHCIGQFFTTSAACQAVYGVDLALNKCILRHRK